VNVVTPGRMSPLPSETEGPPAPSTRPDRRQLPWRSLLVVFPLLWAPLLVWWLAFYPALSTPDSVNSWEQIQTGAWTSHHPPPFTALLWLFTRFTSSPWVLSLAQTVAMAAALAALAVVLSRRFAAGWWPVWAAFVLVALPWVGPFTLEIWKDVPSAIALVVLATALIVATSPTGDRPRPPAWGWTAIVGLSALAAALLRWNGAGTVWVAGVLVAPALVRGLRMRALLACLAGGAVGIGVLVGLPHVTSVQAIPYVESRATFYTDLAVTAHRRPGHLSAADRAALEQAAPIARWSKAGRQCYWINAVLYRFIDKLPQDKVLRADPALTASWERLLKNHPDDIAWARMCRASAALPVIPPQGAGYKSFTVTPQQLLTPAATSPLPWLHTIGLRTLDRFTAPPFLWVFWLPAWWFLLFGAVAAFLWRGLGRRLLVVALSVPVGTIVSYAVTAQSNDARYNLPAIMILVPLTAAVIGHRVLLRRGGGGGSSARAGSGGADPAEQAVPLESGR